MRKIFLRIPCIFSQRFTLRFTFSHGQLADAQLPEQVFFSKPAAFVEILAKNVRLDAVVCAPGEIFGGFEPGNSVHGDSHVLLNADARKL